MESTNNANAVNQSQETQTGTNTNAEAIKRSIAGGIIGATIGYLATPENGKKVMKVVNADNLKTKSADIGDTVKEKSKKALSTVKTSAGKIFSKKESTTQANDVNGGTSETEKLNQRLDKLEDMLNNFIQSKDNKPSQSSSGYNAE
ncbi:GvpT/GvpP family gas vesicle accessory protein [Neobacillus sp. SCS-31]|uniref:GvpT/GvpP family gas vesicle accessory protein n=1 Tax=Neobacillus oceani TaxID=3115292 RepID=UPI003906C147